MSPQVRHRPECAGGPELFLNTRPGLGGSAGEEHHWKGRHGGLQLVAVKARVAVPASMLLSGARAETFFVKIERLVKENSGDTQGVWVRRNVCSKSLLVEPFSNCPCRFKVGSTERRKNILNVVEKGLLQGPMVAYQWDEVVDGDVGNGGFSEVERRKLADGGGPGLDLRDLRASRRNKKRQDWVKKTRAEGRRLGCDDFLDCDERRL